MIKKQASRRLRPNELIKKVTQNMKIQFRQSTNLLLKRLKKEV